MSKTVVFRGTQTACRQFIRANRFSETLRELEMKSGGSGFVVLAIQNDPDDAGQAVVK